MRKFDAGKYGIVIRIVDGHLWAHSPEFGLSMSKRFDEIQKSEEIGRIYLDLLERIDREIRRRNARQHRIPPPHPASPTKPRAPSLSIQEVAHLLGMSANTVRRLCDSGHLKCRSTPGGHRRFHTSDVLAYRTALTGDACATPDSQTE